MQSSTRFVRAGLVAIVSLGAPVVASAQSESLNVYLNSSVLQQDFQTVEKTDPANRTVPEIRNLLPQNRAGAFAAYIIATRPAIALRGLEALRLNKILQSPAASGGTSAVSSAVGPALLGAAIEYGGVLQESSGTMTTLRANALGLSRLIAGVQQFPYCAALDQQACDPWSRWLRRVSTTVSFEQKASSASPTSTAAPLSADLLGQDYRVAAWGLRAELTGAGRFDDPGYLRAWTSAMSQLRGRDAPAAVTAAVSGLFEGKNLDVYSEWREEALVRLRAKTADAFGREFERQLHVLADRLLDADPTFATRLVTAVRAFENYFMIRDDLLMAAQVHKAAVEFTHRTSMGQPATSNLRFVFTHQPSNAPLVLTLNVAATVYDTAPSGHGALRDLQLAGQLDRQLGSLPNLGPAVLSLAGYVQWMEDDALLDPREALAAGAPGLTLAPDGMSLPNTAGSIVMLQGKVTIPFNDIVKVPLSVTWSNRRELIPDGHTMRGQVGLAIDLDGVFK